MTCKPLSLFEDSAYADANPATAANLYLKEVIYKITGFIKASEDFDLRNVGAITFTGYAHEFTMRVLDKEKNLYQVRCSISPDEMAEGENRIDYFQLEVSSYRAPNMRHDLETRRFSLGSEDETGETTPITAEDFFTLLKGTGSRSTYRDYNEKEPNAASGKSGDEVPMGESLVFKPLMRRAQ